MRARWVAFRRARVAGGHPSMAIWPCLRGRLRKPRRIGLGKTDQAQARHAEEARQRLPRCVHDQIPVDADQGKLAELVSAVGAFLLNISWQGLLVPGSILFYDGFT